MKTKREIISAGFIHAIATATYITLVTFIIRYGNAWFGKVDSQWTSIAALMLFVLSAAATGSLIFLRPALWYLDGKKREALQLLGWTIAFFFALTFIAFVSLAIVK